MNIIEIIDILPNLYVKNPKAALVYTVAKSFCTKKGILLVRLGAIAEHLSLSKEEMKEACQLLQQLELVKKENETVVLPEIVSFESASQPTELKSYASSGIPPEYKVLIDEKTMYECYTTLGNQLWKVLAQVANFFHLDYPTLTRLMYNPTFKKQFLDVRRKVEQAAEITGERVTKLKKKKGSSKSTEELVQQLIDEIHIRNGEEIPQVEWKSPQLLRAFVLMYKKRYAEDYHFTGNPFSSLEMREVKKIATAFNEDGKQSVNFLQWCFGTKSYQTGVRNPLSIRFCSADNVMREFIRLQATGGKSAIPSTDISNSKNALLPTTFIEWIVTNYPKVQEVYHLSKIDDIVWLKQAYLKNELPDEALKPIIEEANRLGIQS